ncbi:VOC family protein [Cryptosporangium arvum]|uniref:Lactoylglutathione lyase family protein n=1 Tax=Cryptosporangium arvum DSM 44712 TaxID=927661 RepID=A0A010Z471_9ACTN|nr:VOC family protein [Cryptosporangium arvum]EXG82183.1 lactoylglutathione lyase family protein [Cryptosporangium arvum DSM 44712]
MIPQHPAHGSIGYLQLPTQDLARSAEFYQAVFGWRADLEFGSFEAPGVIGQWTTGREAATGGGPLLWITVDRLSPALTAVTEHGGSVRTRPVLDHRKRWLAEVEDPAGNHLGVVATARTATAQTLLAVRDVEASSRWYQDILGLVSDHGGPSYERLTADGELVLQLHHVDVDHDHGSVIADPAGPVGNGVLVWLGEVADFDGVLARVTEYQATVVRAPHRNPPAGGGNGPAHREIWLRDPDGYSVVVASADGEAWQLGEERADLP